MHAVQRLHRRVWPVYPAGLAELRGGGGCPCAHGRGSAHGTQGQRTSSPPEWPPRALQPCPVPAPCPLHAALSRRCQPRRL